MKENPKRFIVVLSFVIFLVFTILYFLVPLLITPDSVEYYEYIRIFEGKETFSSWNVTRGPSFPVIVFLGTMIFGNSMLGLLSITYVFLLIFLLCFYYLFKKLDQDFKLTKFTKILLVVFFLLLILFNPILFGYFHVLLTEFVAIAMAILSFILCWNWLGVSFYENKVKYIIYTLLFSLLFIFMWFLKQPYVSIILFPLVIAVFLSIIREFSIKNIIQRIGTLLICVILLLISMFVWGKILDSSGVSYEKGTTSEDFLSSSIIGGVSNIRFDEKFDLYNPSSLTENNFISDEEKEFILKKIKDADLEEFKLVKIMSRSGEVVDRIVFSYEGESFSTLEAVLLWLKIAKDYPLIVLDSYFSNYLAASNIYISTRDPNKNYYYPTKTVTDSSHENSSIALNYFVDNDNFKWIADYNFGKVNQLYTKSNINLSTSSLVEGFASFHLKSFKFLYCVLPFILLLVIFNYKKIIDSKDVNKVSLYNLIVILLAASFLHVLFHVVTGAIIDRYIFVVYPEIILGIILLIVVTFNNKKSKNEL